MVIYRSIYFNSSGLLNLHIYGVSVDKFFKRIISLHRDRKYTISKYFGLYLHNLSLLKLIIKPIFLVSL